MRRFLGYYHNTAIYETDELMSRLKEPYDLQKVTLNLRMGDWAWLRIMHGRKGASKVIREMVIGHVERSTNAAAERLADPAMDVTKGFK